MFYKNQTLFIFYFSWEDFFKSVYKQLNKGGKFMFDFNTPKRLADWNAIVYEQSSDMDYVQKVYPTVHERVAINYVYYLKG